MENQETNLKQNKITNFKKFFIAGCCVFTFALCFLVGYIHSSPKLEETLIIVKDGQKMESLDVDNIVIVPGESSEYQISLLTRLVDNYKVCFSVEGQKDELSKLIDISIIDSEEVITNNLSEITNAGEKVIGYRMIDNDSGYVLKIKYDFSPSITYEMIHPIDVKISFSIGR